MAIASGLEVLELGYSCIADMSHWDPDGSKGDLFVKVCNYKVQSSLILSYPVYFKSPLGENKLDEVQRSLLLLDFVGIALLWRFQVDFIAFGHGPFYSEPRLFSVTEDSSPSEDLSTLGGALAWDCMKRRQTSSFVSCTLRSHRFLAKSVGCVVSLPWLVRLDCHLARLPLQTLRILHLPGNEISKLEDPISAMRGRHISHGRVLKVEFWD